MSKRDVCKLIRLLENHKTFATCQIESCKKCSEIKCFGEALWSKKQVEKKVPLQKVGTLTKRYYSEAVKKGYIMIEIAEVFGMTKSQMSYWLGKNKVKHSNILKSRNAEIIKLVKEGCSYDNIASKYNLTEAGIRRVIEGSL